MISFDGTNLQSAVYLPRYHQHDSTPNREGNYLEFAGKAGGKLLDPFYKDKTIKVIGKIVGTSQADLESKIDIMKELLSRKEKNLDITYAGSTRKYVATVNSPVKIERDAFHITHAPYEIDFFVPLGYGKATASTNISANGITASPHTQTDTYTGSRPPLPIITITINAENALTVIKIENTTTGDDITITPTGGYAAADILIINTETNTVTINGTEEDFTGIFPTFVVGSNSVVITCTSTTHNYDLDIDYTPLYL